MEHESFGDIHYNWRVRYRHQGIGKGTGGLENKRTSRDLPNYSIVEIGQNTEMSLGNLRRFIVTQTPANTVVKISQMSKITIIIPKYQK